MAINADHAEPPTSTNSSTVQSAAAAAAATAAVTGGGSWWNVLNWIADSLMFVSCRPTKFLSLLLPNWSCSSLMRSPPLKTSMVIGTILIVGDDGRKKNVELIFQDQDTPKTPFLILDLPINANHCDLSSGPCRIALECDRARSGGGPLLGVDTWRVYVNGRKVGFGWRRESEFDAGYSNNIGWALETLRVVSTGVGILMPPSTGGGGGGGRMEYLRGRFEKVVGCADSQSYHLVDPAVCLQGHALSFFFVRL